MWAINWIGNFLDFFLTPWFLVSLRTIVSWQLDTKIHLIISYVPSLKFANGALFFFFLIYTYFWCMWGFSDPRGKRWTTGHMSRFPLVLPSHLEGIYAWDYSLAIVLPRSIPCPGGSTLPSHLHTENLFLICFRVKTEILEGINYLIYLCFPGKRHDQINIFWMNSSTVSLYRKNLGVCINLQWPSKPSLVSHQ